MSLVTTTVGEVPEEDLAISEEREDHKLHWIVRRVCKYTGTAHPEVFGQVVRQDVWLTMKAGQGASAEAGL